MEYSNRCGSNSTNAIEINSIIKHRNCYYEVPIAGDRRIRERKKVYERRKLLFILQMVAYF